MRAKPNRRRPANHEARCDRNHIGTSNIIEGAGRTEATDQPCFLGTGQIGKMYGVTSQCVANWMTRGIEFNGNCIRLQYLRIGRAKKARTDWLEQFIAQLNTDTPAIAETPAEHSRRVAADIAAMNAALSS